MWEKTNIKSLFFAAISFLVLILLAYGYFFVYSKIKFLSSEMGSATRSIAVLDEKRKDFELARSNLEKQSGNMEILESAFFSESGFVALLNTFEDVAKTVGVKFEAKGATLPESKGVAEISFEISGNFNPIVKFLILLNNIRYSGLTNKFSLFESNEKSKTLTANMDYLLFNYK